MGQCLQEEIEEINPSLKRAGVTQQGGLTRLDYSFHVNAYKHLNAKGYPPR